MVRWTDAFEDGFMGAVSIEALHRSEDPNLRRFLLRALGNPADAALAAANGYHRHRR